MKRRLKNLFKSLFQNVHLNRGDEKCIQISYQDAPFVVLSSGNPEEQRTKSH